MKSSPSYRITPWVGRIIIANAVVLLMLMTLFTSRDAFRFLQFSPQTAFSRPWTFVSYMFVHAGLLHLLANMLMLFVFGTAVESRMGSRNFLTYYLFCGIGACQDCLVTVDGVGGVRACVAPVHAGTSITTGGGAARG